MLPYEYHLNFSSLAISVGLADVLIPRWLVGPFMCQD